MTTKDSNSFIPYLNKFVYQHNNAYHHSNNKKAINSDYYAFIEKIETNPKTPEFLSIKIFLAKVTLKFGQEKYLLSILF